MFCAEQHPIHSMRNPFFENMSLLLTLNAAKWERFDESTIILKLIL
jgi:hypothetical protein